MLYGVIMLRLRPTKAMLLKKVNFSILLNALWGYYVTVEANKSNAFKEGKFLCSVKCFMGLLC